MDPGNNQPNALSPKLRQQMDELLATTGLTEEAEGPETIDHPIVEKHLHELVRLVNDVGLAADNEMPVSEAREMATVVALSMLKFGLDFPGTAKALIDSAGEEMAQLGQTVAAEIYNHLYGRCGRDN